MTTPQIAGAFQVVSDPEYRLVGDKGHGKLRLRCMAKDSVPDGNGGRKDSTPLFITVDVMSWHGGEKLYDSIVKGDTVMVIGHLKREEYEAKDGSKKDYIFIDATECGVSTRWDTAKTTKSLESSGAAGVRAAVEGLGATEVDPWASAADPIF